MHPFCRNLYKNSDLFHSLYEVRCREYLCSCELKISRCNIAG
uniref:Uncharacterized protein n=1 Tax=Arundo donax TaxID=35708 RepID=A0A0A9F1T3_ARUDO